MQYQFPNIEDRTLTKMLAYHADKKPDAPFMQFCNNPALTFAQMAELTDRIANGFSFLGARKGSRIAILSPNCAEFVPIWFGAAKIGTIEVPLNPDLKGKLLSYVLEDCASEILVCHASRLNAVSEVLRCRKKLFRHLVVVGGPIDVDEAQEIVTDSVLSYAELTAFPATAVDPAIASYHDPLAILYTSGTTGAAKGVIMPHHQYYIFAESMARNMGITSEDRYYTPLPLFHGDAQLFGVYFPLVFGTSGVIYDRFSASRYWDQVRQCGATATNLLGAMAHILWKQPEKPTDRQHSLRVAQALPMVPFKRSFEQRFGMTLVTAYGQTETSFVTYDTPDNWKENACGKAAPGFDVQIVDVNDNPLPSGQVGEIVVRSHAPWSMSQGYFGKPEKTVESYRNLWFHSGDSGWMDDEGWLYFAGRIKDVIRRRGENVSAHEVESVIDDHAAVVESAAIAVPSELSEDDIKVFVVLKDGHDLTAEELLAFCETRMPHFMVPRYVEFRRALLPRTPSEKIAKEELRKEPMTPATWDREAAGYQVKRA